MNRENGEPVVPLDTWRRLYAAAGKVREMEPWRWMEETEFFGVWPADRDTAAFVSVMGALGEYYAVGVYPSPREWHQIRQLQSMPENERHAERLLEIAHLQAIFGGVRDLEARDKRIIRDLGLKFRGDTAWPCFRSFRPGYFPWFLEPSEAQLLTVALEQLLEIAPRAQKDHSLLLAEDSADRVLVRQPVGNQADGPWTEMRHMFPPVVTTFQMTIPTELITAVRELKPFDLHLEVDVFPMPARIGKRGQRPQWPQSLLVVDSRSLYILGCKLLTVDTTVEAMWAAVPKHLLHILRKNDMRPASLTVRTPRVYAVLDALCGELGIKLEVRPFLPALSTVRQDMERLYNKR